MLTFLFLNQTLWCDHSLESSRRDDFNKGYIIGIVWEMRTLSWKQFCSLFLNCSPAVVTNCCWLPVAYQDRWLKNIAEISRWSFLHFPTYFKWQPIFNTTFRTRPQNVFLYLNLTYGIFSCQFLSNLLQYYQTSEGVGTK